MTRNCMITLYNDKVNKCCKLTLCLAGRLWFSAGSRGVVHGAVGTWFFKVDRGLRTEAVRRTTFLLLLMLLSMRFERLVPYEGEATAGAVVVLVHFIAGEFIWLVISILVCKSRADKSTSNIQITDRVGTDKTYLAALLLICKLELWDGDCGWL